MNDRNLWKEFLLNQIEIKQINNNDVLLIVQDKSYDLFCTIFVLTFILSEIKNKNILVRNLYPITKSTYNLLIYNNDFLIKDVFIDE